MKETIITTSWDDGHKLDMKLFEMLQEYDISATFYIPIKNHEFKGDKGLDEQQIKEISKHFDIGGHTYHHKILTELKKKEAYEEIIQGKRKLEEIVKAEIESFCYPSGKYNTQIKQLVKKAGFESARTVKQLSYCVPYDFFEMETTVHVGASNINHVMAYLKHNSLDKNFDLVLKSLLGYPFRKNWFDLSLSLIDYIEKRGGIFHLWGHSWEIEKNDAWKNLKKISAGGI